jgi:hypothetical protein
MILSFGEFNALYESYNDDSYTNQEYSNGLDVLESLFTVMYKKGSLTESEVVTFLDNVLYETGWELNDEVYESYAEWLDDWAPYIDAQVNEDENEMELFLTRRGVDLLEDGGVWDKVKGAVSNTAKNIGNDAKFVTAKGAGGIGQRWKGMSTQGKVAAGLGGAALVGGAALGARALIKRRNAKKAAAAGQPAQPQR